MEQTIVHLAHIAAWTFAIIFGFAIIGVIATVRFILNLVHRTEQAVEGGVQHVEETIHNLGHPS